MAHEIASPNILKEVETHAINTVNVVVNKHMRLSL